MPTDRTYRTASRLHEHPLGVAHFGFKKTYDKFCHFFFALNAYPVIKEICDNCTLCPIVKHENKTARTSMGTVQTKQRWEILSLDLSGPFPLSNYDNKYLLTAVDLFTKFTILIPIPNMKAITVARAVLRNVIAHFGVPLNILTDRGGSFESQILQQLCDSLNINKLRTMSHHPQGNASNERSHQTVNRLLRTFIEGGYGQNWDEVIPLIALAINSNINETTNFMPYEALMGATPRLPDELIYGQLPEEDRTLEEEIQNIKFQLSKIGEQVISNTSKAHLAQAKQYNKKEKHTWYSEGDLVYVKYHPSASEVGKLAPKWKGPFEIINTKRFPILEVNEDEKIIAVHHDHLKKCKITKEQLYLRHETPQGAYFVKKKGRPPCSWDEEDVELTETDNSEEVYEDCPDEHNDVPEATSRYNLRPRPSTKK